jgi:hypothetical protein
MNPTPFPNLDMPVVDPATGKITKQWYQLIASLYLLLGGPDPVSTPDLGVMSGLMDENFSATIEVENAVNALRNALSLDDALLARIVELEKRLNDLELGAAFEQQGQTTNTLTGATTAIPPAGNGIGSIPAAPIGYLTLNIAGAVRQIPYY